MRAPVYMLDTNIASYVIKGNRPSVDRMLGRVGPECVCISVITEAELRFGTARRPDSLRIAERVADFLAIVDVLPWDSAAAKQYAQLRATLERTGTVMANLDLMIAAHVLACGVTLVTNDHAFRRVDGLTVVDWSE